MQVLPCAAQNGEDGRETGLSPGPSWPEDHSTSGIFGNLSRSFPTCHRSVELRFQRPARPAPWLSASLCLVIWDGVAPLKGSGWLLRGLTLLWGSLLLSEKAEQNYSYNLGKAL